MPVQRWLATADPKQYVNTATKVFRREIPQPFRPANGQPIDREKVSTYAAVLEDERSDRWRVAIALAKTVHTQDQHEPRSHKVYGAAEGIQTVASIAPRKWLKFSGKHTIGEWAIFHVWGVWGPGRLEEDAHALRVPEVRPKVPEANARGIPRESNQSLQALPLSWKQISQTKEKMDRARLWKTGVRLWRNRAIPWVVGAEQIWPCREGASQKVSVLLTAKKGTWRNYWAGCTACTGD